MKKLDEVIARCEQYWNESGIGDAEVHSVFGFIRSRAVLANAEIDRLRSELAEAKADAERWQVARQTGIISDECARHVDESIALRNAMDMAYRAITGNLSERMSQERGQQCRQFLI